MNKLLQPPTERFSNRVDDYVKFRPTYPPELMAFLKKEVGLTSDKTVADIGAGTGIFTALLLDNGNRVYAVEPNQKMREAAEERFKGNASFVSVPASAEQTTLEDRSVDLVFAAQAFHWFDIEKTRKEFFRILKPEGYVCLLWNIRDAESSPFARDYERLLLDFGTDYQVVKVAGARERELIVDFFKTHRIRVQEFKQEQILTLEQLRGRLNSSSYCPTPEDPRFMLMMKRLDEIFAKNQQDGHVVMAYGTRLYWGKIKPSGG